MNPNDKNKLNASKIDHIISDAKYKTKFSATKPSIRTWSWLLGLLTLTFALLVPLAGVYNAQFEKKYIELTGSPSDIVWRTGDLATGHKTPDISQNCNVCHKKPFVKVEDKACTDCHDDIKKHRAESKSKQESESKPQPQPNHILAQRCASCHREHNEPAQIIVRKDALCTECHTNIKAQEPDTLLRNVSDFSKNHPEFLLSFLVPDGTNKWTLIRNAKDGPIKQEKSNLLFDHKVHLAKKGIDAPDGNKIMKCDDCHQVNAASGNILPVTMEKHCSECHLLIFDENDLTREITHGQPKAVLRELEEYYSRIALLGYPSQSAKESAKQSTKNRGNDTSRILAINNSPDGRKSAEKTRKKARQTAKIIFERSVCITCHSIIKNNKNPLFPWRVKPVKLNKTWLPKAYFNHSSHDKAPCKDCHNAKKSKSASDVLIPKIKVCRKCHGDKNTKNKLVSTCIDCHKLHIPNNKILTGRTKGRGIYQRLPRNEIFFTPF